VSEAMSTSVDTGLNQSAYRSLSEQRLSERTVVGRYGEMRNVCSDYLRSLKGMNKFRDLSIEVRIILKLSFWFVGVNKWATGMRRVKLIKVRTDSKRNIRACIKNHR
jgi:hypothetical protein